MINCCEVLPTSHKRYCEYRLVRYDNRLNILLFASSTLCSRVSEPRVHPPLMGPQNQINTISMFAFTTNKQCPLQCVSYRLQIFRSDLRACSLPKVKKHCCEAVPTLKVLRTTVKKLLSKNLFCTFLRCLAQSTKYINFLCCNYVV